MHPDGTIQSIGAIPGWIGLGDNGDVIWTDDYSKAIKVFTTINVTVNYPTDLNSLSYTYKADG